MLKVESFYESVSPASHGLDLLSQCNFEDYITKRLDVTFLGTNGTKFYEFILAQHCLLGIQNLNAQNPNAKPRMIG